MSIFLLPKIIHDIRDNDIQFKMLKKSANVIVSHSLYHSLCETKIQIEKNYIGWDSCKKITNPYEFIHTIIPGYKTQVSKLTPLSRSFYKMIEMSTLFNLCSKYATTDTIPNKELNNLLSDYVHNLSNNPLNMNEFEWYLHDNYYYDVGTSGNVNENGIFNENIHGGGNSFIMCKNKNIFYEKRVKNPNPNPFEFNDTSDANDANDANDASVDNDVNDVNDANDANDVNYDEKFYSNSKPQQQQYKFKSFHLAEGPGGFIEAVAHIRKNKSDEYYGMTLINNDTKCPGWRSSKKFLEDNPNVIIEKGIDNTGNLLSRDNFIHCYHKYKNSMDLVTGDGGVDFSEDFNNQEYTATKLILAQVVYALAMQSNNGNFVLKVFDTFSNAMIDILYLLSSLYKHTYIMKPQTSRYANSEKYIICKGYNLDENKERIENIIEKMYDNFDNLNSNVYIETIFKFNYSRTFISKMEEINIIIGKKQIDNIVTTLNLMINKNFDKIDYYKKKHIQKCIKWCEKFNINFHKNIKSTNIFLASASHLNFVNGRNINKTAHIQPSHHVFI
jgi:23S rRNA U2552 (ribose-2'-O)-methylase RlmE/FtsJ